MPHRITDQVGFSILRGRLPVLTHAWQVRLGAQLLPETTPRPHTLRRLSRSPLNGPASRTGIERGTSAAQALARVQHYTVETDQPDRGVQRDSDSRVPWPSPCVLPSASTTSTGSTSNGRSQYSENMATTVAAGARVGGVARCQAPARGVAAGDAGGATGWGVLKIESCGWPAGGRVSRQEWEGWGMDATGGTRCAAQYRTGGARGGAASQTAPLGCAVRSVKSCPGHGRGRHTGLITAVSHMGSQISALGAWHPSAPAAGQTSNAERPRVHAAALRAQGLAC